MTRNIVTIFVAFLIAWVGVGGTYMSALWLNANHVPIDAFHVAIVVPLWFLTWAVTVVVEGAWLGKRGVL